ncbi:hypothetical protein COO59_01025 [Mixta theicola]|uniref:Uncharacterized protein n=1 Tax=Mixta theicola TaxID=1458355 RepID=A0A2K1QF98_9GAMM|nr:hypothetical protein COO59_01025 [Mixta theicola]
MAIRLLLALLLLPLCLLADCLPEANVQLYAQQSWIHKDPSRWQIMQKNPYRGNNSVSDMAIRYDNRCELIENALNTDISLLALAYYPWQTPAAFEKDRRRTRAALYRLSFSYQLSDASLITAGKFSAKPGLFYLKSPADLLHNYYAGFKPGRIYDPTLQEIYSESFWGVKLSTDALNYAWSLTVVPQLTQIDKRYESSGSWSAIERSNASERYLLSYTDYRLLAHTPSASLRLGDSRTLAVADSFHPAPQWTFNAELAWHAKQQWRHLAGERVEQVQNGIFPSVLFQRDRRNGIELALSGQYTTYRFSQLGVEYYFQSEGYSRHQWRRQINFIRYLNQRTGFAPVDRAFDAYKYLMAAEINNITNKGNLQGKHYLNTYATLVMNDDASLRAYGIVNMQDKSAMLGVHFNKPLTQAKRNIDIYSGLYCTQGSSDSEFGLFGKTAGIYSGFKYYF